MAEDKAADEVEPKALKASFEISYKIAKAGKTTQSVRRLSNR
jgi:hypothetical protein